MQLKTIYISFFILLLAVEGFAQPSKPIQIRLTSDQLVYAVGEEIWVDGFIVKEKTESKTIMLRLVDRKGATKSIVPLAIDQNQFSGRILVQETWASDYYFLDAWISGETSETRLLPIMVINPRFSFDKACEAKGVNQKEIQSSEKIKINLSKNLVEKREEVELTISGENIFLTNQWTVTREDALTELAAIDVAGFNETRLHTGNSKMEKEGRVLGVKVSSEGRPAAGIRIIAALKGKKAIVGTATADVNGIAQFILPITAGKTELSFTAINSSGKPLVYELLMDESEAKAISFPCMVLKEEMRSDIESRVFNSRIATKFQQEGLKFFTVLDKDSSDFYGKPDSKYVLDEYVRFPNMEEVITEIIPDVRIKKEGGRLSLQVLNIPTRSFFNEEALILVDGIPLNKTKELLESDPLLVRTIEVVSKKYILGNLEFSGIVHFKTYKGDLGNLKESDFPVSTNFTGVQETAIHQSPSFITERLPDFRNLISLEKNIRFDSSGKSTIKFRVSDSEGMYRVKFKGLSANGEYLESSVLFQVK